MQKTRIVCIMLVLLLTLPLFCSCGVQKQSKTYFDLFDTVVEIICYNPDVDFEAVCTRVSSILQTYHTLCDIYTPPAAGQTTLYTVNAEAAVAPVTVDARLYQLLQFGVVANAQTYGAVQITYGAVLKLWHTARETGVLPTEAALAEAQKHTNPASLILDDAAQTVWFADADLQLDLGALAKGYAVERAAEALEADGIQGVLINAGGNVRAVGAKTADTPWTVAITNPKGEGALGYVSCTDGAFVTSGSYRRFLEVDGKRYAHIIDPNTGQPANRFLSVTVQTADSAIGDMLSTALFILDEAQGRALAEQFDAEVLWVSADRIFTTEHFVYRTTP